MNLPASTASNHFRYGMLQKQCLSVSLIWNRWQIPCVCRKITIIWWGGSHYPLLCHDITPKYVKVHHPKLESKCLHPYMTSNQEDIFATRMVHKNCDEGSKNKVSFYFLVKMTEKHRCHLTQFQWWWEVTQFLVACQWVTFFLLWLLEMTPITCNFSLSCYFNSPVLQMVVMGRDTFWVGVVMLLSSNW